MYFCDMYFQQLDVDIATISKSANGRVLFYNADGDCVLGVSEMADVQLNFNGNYIYIFQAGGGTAVFNNDVPNTPMAINCSFYKFTVVGLTDIDGRPFTALEQPNYDQNTYKAKVREAYEYLVSNIFVGCCNTGTDGILWYADEASFPATGIVETLYVDMATPALFMWNGSAYVAFGGGGGGVASVTGYSVDNTDPVNPIVKAIPTAGTNASEPVTGNVEVSGGVEMFVENSARAGVLWDDGSVGLEAEEIDGSNLTAITVVAGASQVSSASPSYQGLVYDIDYSANFNNLSLINQLVMKSRFWTKAGAPTTTDDSTQGYVVGSLLRDTTNNILYRCTSNTASAATWVYNDIQSEIIRAGATVATVTTRWLVPGLSGFGTSAVVNMVEKAIHTTYRVVTGSAQPATGTLTVTREFTSPTGTVLQTDVLTIAAGSAIGEYTFTGATFDARAITANVKYVFLNNATSASAFVQGLERNFVR